MEEFKKLREEKAKIWHGHLQGQMLADVLERDLMEAVRSAEWETGIWVCRETV